MFTPPRQPCITASEAEGSVVPSEASSMGNSTSDPNPKEVQPGPSAPTFHMEALSTKAGATDGLETRAIVPSLSISTVPILEGATTSSLRREGATDIRDHRTCLVRDTDCCDRIRKAPCADVESGRCDPGQGSIAPSLFLQVLVRTFLNSEVLA
ncbi:hypothetical protein BJX62DRAFT_85820 [Aspergillus germanicus]